MVLHARREFLRDDQYLSTKNRSKFRAARLCHGLRFVQNAVLRPAFFTALRRSVASPRKPVSQRFRGGPVIARAVVSGGRAPGGFERSPIKKRAVRKFPYRPLLTADRRTAPCGERPGFGLPEKRITRTASPACPDTRSGPSRRWLPSQTALRHARGTHAAGGCNGSRSG